MSSAVEVRLVPAPPPLPPPTADRETDPTAPPALPSQPTRPAAEGHAAATTRARPSPVAGRRRTPAPGSGGGAPGLDPRQACCMVALAAVEVLDGSRPLAQLARWLTPEVYDTLARRAALTAPAGRVLDAAASGRDLTTEPGAAGVARRPTVRRVRVHRVDDDTLEASVVVAHADRVRAVAVRLTRSTGRWRAAALVVG